ncbi:MAG: methylthioribulose 1-phosphate dehydratase [Acidobacteriaceae bacterium]
MQLKPVLKRDVSFPSENDTEEVFHSLASDLSEIGREFYARGWVLGTSGNFSAVIQEYPLRIAITSTGLDKAYLSPDQFLEIDGSSTVLQGAGSPSAETLLHLTLVRERDAKAVLHTHSVWSTVLSGRFAADGGIAIEDFEMLKGLAGVQTHEHREWLPILDNSQDMKPLSRTLTETLQRHSGSHGFLLKGHGLYTWGASIREAKRHVEIFEFLMEALVRQRSLHQA